MTKKEAYAEIDRTVFAALDAQKTGTPKTLREAISNGRKVDPGTPTIHEHVRDFLAQKFGAAFLESEGETLAKLQELWTAVTGEDSL